MIKERDAHNTHSYLEALACPQTKTSNAEPHADIINISCRILPVEKWEYLSRASTLLCFWLVSKFARFLDEDKACKRQKNKIGLMTVSQHCVNIVH